MPFYDLRCGECKAESRVMASMSEKQDNRIRCPQCGSNNMENMFKAAPGYIKSRSKTPDCANLPKCGSNCPHAIR